MVKIKLIGDKDLERKLNLLADNLQKKIVKDAIKVGSKPMLDKSKERCLILTGSLQKSLKIKAFSRKGKIGIRIVTSDASLRKTKHAQDKKRKTGKSSNKQLSLYRGDQFYGAFIEYGTKHQKAYPWLRESFDSTKQLVITKVGQEIKKGVESVR